jgi:2-polyprenyl-6-methoxyphenol hydroxylase-like FAD-dependent oxidoreductase
MTRNIHTIIGAGPVGLLLGCLLAKRGIPCQVLEQAERRSELTKALMIHSASLDILSTIDVDGDILERGLPQRYIHFDIEGGARFSLDFSCIAHAGYPGFINLRQPLVEEILERRLVELGGCVLRGHRLAGLAQDAGGISLVVETMNGREHARVPCVIGCDGANSAVRALSDVAFVGTDYPFQYILAEGVPMQRNLSEDASYMVINERAALSIVPMDNGEYRIAGPGRQLSPTDGRLTEEAVEALIRDTGLESIPNLSTYSAIRRYTVRERCAERFAVGRVFLCGDAAHVHSPAGGQAMNLGFGDAFSLAWRLARNTEIEHIGESWAVERMRMARHAIAQAQIGPLLAKMRGHAVSADELSSLAQIYSQLFHDVYDEETPLCQRRLQRGARIPNLPLPEGDSLWARLGTQEKIDLSETSGIGRALAEYFGEPRATVYMRPDFYIDRVEAGSSL